MHQYLAYDIILNENNQIAILKYRVVDEEKRVHGRKEYYRKYFYFGDFVSEQLKEELIYLKENNFLAMTRFKSFDFDLFTLNPLVTVQFMVLARKHKVLEKFYQVDTHIQSFITYVNMETGDLLVMKVHDYGLYSLEKEQELLNEGYRPVQNSYVYAHQEDFDRQIKR